MDRPLSRFKTSCIGVVSLLGFLALWYGLTHSGLIEEGIFPAPDTVWEKTIEMFTDTKVVGGEPRGLVWDILHSTRRVLLGYGIAVLVGVPFGLLLGMLPLLRAIFNPVISLVRPLPSLTWIPITILWLGIEESQKYAIVFMGCICPVLVYTIDAAMRVDPVLIRAARNLGSGRRQVIWNVVLPACLPRILSGLKVVLAIAWTCIISAEMVAAETGLGQTIWDAKVWLDMPRVVVGMVFISLVVLVMDICFTLIERLVIRWQP